MRLIVILILAAPTILFAQSRENRPKLNFGTTSNILEKATGWAYNSTLGEWIDYENFIIPNKDYKGKSKSLLNGYLQSTLTQNFIRIQSKTVNYLDKKYYVLIVQKWRGEYKYESLKQDWYIWKETFGYIFTESEYSKLKNMTGQIELRTQFSESIGSANEKYDETKFLDLIQTELGKTKNKLDSEYKFPILNTEANGKKVIRFYLPDSFPSYLNYDFEVKYFEASPTEFEKIIIKE